MVLTMEIVIDRDSGATCVVEFPILQYFLIYVKQGGFMKKNIFTVICMTFCMSSFSYAVTIESKGLDQSEMNKPALCESTSVSTDDIFLNLQPEPMLMAADIRSMDSSVSGTLVLSEKDFQMTDNPNMVDYLAYASSLCIQFARKVAESSCDINTKWVANMNQNITIKPKIVEISTRLYKMQGMYGLTQINQVPLMPSDLISSPYFIQNQTVSCNGNGLVLNISSENLQ